MTDNNNNNNKKQVPEWSLQLTEKLISPRSSNISSSPLIIHTAAQNNDEQFENYIDRQFTSNDATVLKKRLSETPSKKLSEGSTLRNSSNIPPDFWSNIKDVESKPQQQEPNINNRPILPHEESSSSDLESQEKQEWWLAKDDEDGFYSISGLFFVFGFIFPPLWWIGAIWPRHIKERGGKMAERWQKLNRVMSIGFSTILLILIIVFVIIYATGNS
jgi:hypothetical protein